MKYLNLILIAFRFSHADSVWGFEGVNPVWNAVEIRWERIGSGGVVSVERERMKNI